MKRRALLLGLVAGGLGGLLTIAFGIGLPWLGFAAFAVGALARPRPFGLVGTLVGWGGAWFALFLRAALACGSATCSGPDMVPWLVVAAAIAVVGVAIGVAAARRGRSADTSPS